MSTCEGSPLSFNIPTANYAVCMRILPRAARLWQSSSTAGNPLHSLVAQFIFIKATPSYETAFNGHSDYSVDERAFAFIHDGGRFKNRW